MDKKQIARKIRELEEYRKIAGNIIMRRLDDGSKTTVKELVKEALAKTED